MIWVFYVLFLADAFPGRSHGALLRVLWMRHQE